MSSLRIIWLTTLIFCLRHRCTKNQSFQVFRRVEQRFKSSEGLHPSPPKFCLHSEKILSSVSRGEFFRGVKTFLNRDVKRNCKCFQSPDHPPLLREIARVPSGQIVSASPRRKTSLNRPNETETKFSVENSV